MSLKKCSTKVITVASLNLCVCTLLRTVVLFVSRLVISEFVSSAARSRAMGLCRYLSIASICGGIDHNAITIPYSGKCHSGSKDSSVSMLHLLRCAVGLFAKWQR